MKSYRFPVRLYSDDQYSSASDRMKILSHQEFKYLTNPDEFNRQYGDVLRHRLKKKAESMERTLQLIKASSAMLPPKERKIAHWSSIVRGAFMCMNEENRSKWEPAYDRYVETEKKIDYSKENRYKKINKNLWDYQREIVRLFLGEKYLIHEAHPKVI